MNYELDQINTSLIADYNSKKLLSIISNDEVCHSAMRILHYDREHYRSNFRNYSFQEKMILHDIVEEIVEKVERVLKLANSSEYVNKTRLNNFIHRKNRIVLSLRLFTGDIINTF